VMGCPFDISPNKNIGMSIRCRGHQQQQSFHDPPYFTHNFSIQMIARERGEIDGSIRLTLLRSFRRANEVSAEVIALSL
jgi:hypothetical protein